MNSTTNSLDTSTSAAVQADQVTSIRLYGSGANPIILDSIPGSAIEPLTLETFGALAQRHHVVGKNLIIARVDVAINDANLEPDELPETRSFYYHAHSLNKILFRTFGRNGEYLFRLFALNPMTNTDMVGDVVYFMIYPGTPVHRLRPRSISNPGRHNILQGTAISQQVGPSSDLTALQTSGPTFRTIATPSGILELCENDFSALETMMATGHASVPTPPAVRSPNRSRGASADGAASVRSATNLRSFEHLMEQSIGKSNQIRIAEVVGPRLNDAVLLADNQHGSANVGDRSAGSATQAVVGQSPSSGPLRGHRSRASSVGAGVTSRPQPSAGVFGDRRTSTGQQEAQSTAVPVLRPTRSFGDSEPAPTDASAVSKAASSRRTSRTPRARPDLHHSAGSRQSASDSVDNHVDTPSEPDSAGMSRSPSAASDGAPVRGKDFAARLRERLESHTSSTALHHSALGVSRRSASLVLLTNRNPTAIPTSQPTQPIQSLYHSPIPFPEASSSPSNSNWKITIRPKTRTSSSNAGVGINNNHSSSRHLVAQGVHGSQPAVSSHPTAALDAARYLAVAASQPASGLLDRGSLPSVISSGDGSTKVSADGGATMKEKSEGMLSRTTSPEPVSPSLSPSPPSHPAKSVVLPDTQTEQEELGCSTSGCASALSKSAPVRTSGPPIRIGVNVSLSRNSQRSSTSMSSQFTGLTTAAPLILHAMFIGTDDDFLTMPHLRAAFAQNALTPDDMALFEISREMLLDEGIVLPELLDELGVNIPGVGVDLVDEDVNALGELSLADDSPGMNPYLPPDPILGADGEIISPPGVDDWTNFMMDPSAVDPSAHSPPSSSAYAFANNVVSPNRRGSRTAGSVTLTYNGARRQSVTTSNPFNIPTLPTSGGRRRSSLQPLHMASAHQAVSEDRYADTIWRRLRLWTTVMQRTESWESNETLPLEQHHRIRHAVTNLSQGGTKYLVVTCVAVAALLMVGLFWSAGLSHDMQLLLIVSICVFYFGGMASLCVVDYRSIKHRRHMRHRHVGPQPGLSGGGGGGDGGGSAMANRAGNAPAVNRRVNTVGNS